MRIKTVLMDIDDTIFDFTKSARESILHAARDMRITFTEDMLAYYFQLNVMLWEDFENGEINREYIFEQRFPRVFEEFNIDADGLEFEKKFHKYFKYEYVFVDGAKEVLAYLAGKYNLYVVSNSAYDTQYCRLTNAGICSYFKELFVSDKIGYQKPAKEFFECCFKQIPDFNPEETIIIGDSLTSDMKGGIMAGIKTCWLNTKGIKELKTIKPDYEILSLEEIKQIL
jgi:2-haloacid dehalogenase